ncbi:MAG: 3-hydroxyacyl-CoA dehydrogenase NAD-binding domain-containing protein [Nitrospira sp.]|nr:3-hydroxyacyl-CoA dehydrogenase NAD-binding domain-containing protein [Nitrospira sp.]
MEIKKVAVLGAGIMGAGIAQVAAQVGLQVNMRDIDDKFLNKGMSNIKQSLGRIVKKERMAQAEAEAVLAHIICTKDMIEAVRDVDVVIEAIPENMALKKETYAKIDAACPVNVIFASNTSGLSITDMASATKRPDRFVGMHFFNPVPMMQLVEIVKGYSTSDATVKVIEQLAVKMGKTTVIARDTPGFITTRLICTLMNEAVHCYTEGIASAQDIDRSMKLGMNHPMGPLELADFVGLDTLLYIMDSLHREYGDPKYRPPLLLRQMVRAGHLGRKTGNGFYDYTEQK